MNTTYTVNETGAARSILLIVANSDCIGNWLMPTHCPLASMLDLFRSIVRFFFVAAAGAVLALAGIVLVRHVHLW